MIDGACDAVASVAISTRFACSTLVFSIIEDEMPDLKPRQDILMPLVCALGLMPMSATLRAADSLPTEIVQTIRKDDAGNTLRYLTNRVDLNGDGRPEILVYLIGPMVCGTGGCGLHVFTPTSTGYVRVAQTSVTRLPIRVARAKSAGWRNLIVHSSGGGATGRDVELRFDGRTYPANPSVPGRYVKNAQAGDGDRLIDDINGADEAAPFPELDAADDTSATPSFDCLKARSTVERQICADPALAALDRRVSALFARGMAAHSALSDRDRKGWRDVQRVWLTERDRCGRAEAPKTCITTAYQHRIAELRIRLADLGPVPDTVSYRCDGLGNQPLAAVFYGQTEPPSVVLTVGDRQVIGFSAPSGSGARYVTSGVELWEHHGEAMLEWFGKKLSCRALK